MFTHWPYRLLCAGLLFTALMGLFPPWVQTHYLYSPTIRLMRHDAGYQWLVAPRPTGDCIPTAAVGAPTWEFPSCTFDIDWSRLLLQWVVLWGLVGGVVLLRVRKPDSGLQPTSPASKADASLSSGRRG